MFDIFHLLPFPPQNSVNKRISSLWIDMIRVCDISKHRPKPEVTFSEGNVIWGYEVKLLISVIWRRSTCLWVGCSSRTRKMTLENRLLHRNRNKMNWWNCILLRPNALKSSHFHIQNAIKTLFMKGMTWNLVHTFFRGSSSTYIPFFFGKVWNLGWFFEKKMTKSQTFQHFQNFENAR